jgi:hypothetical protein
MADSVAQTPFDLIPGKPSAQGFHRILSHQAGVLSAEILKENPGVNFG